jgi:hypothetical protein
VHYTPTYASWLNQVDIWFNLITQRAIRRGAFKSGKDLISKIDDLVKSRNSIKFVIPAKAGIQLFQDVLDPGFRRGDALRDFLRDHQN